MTCNDCGHGLTLHSERKGCQHSLNVDSSTCYCKKYIAHRLKCKCGHDKISHDAGNYCMRLACGCTRFRK